METMLLISYHQVSLARRRCRHRTNVVPARGWTLWGQTGSAIRQILVPVKKKEKKKMTQHKDKALTDVVVIVLVQDWRLSEWRRLACVNLWKHSKSSWVLFILLCRKCKKVEQVSHTHTHLSQSQSLAAPVWLWRGWRRFGAASDLERAVVLALGTVDPPVPVSDRGGPAGPGARRGGAGRVAACRGSTAAGRALSAFSPVGGRTGRAPRAAAETWRGGRRR